MVYVEISAKNNKYVYLSPILWKLEVTHGLGCWVSGKLKVGFLLALIELFVIYYVPELWGEMCTLYSSDVFTGIDHFALKFYLDTVVPQQPFLASEN